MEEVWALFSYFFEDYISSLLNLNPADSVMYVQILTSLEKCPKKLLSFVELNTISLELSLDRILSGLMEKAQEGSLDFKSFDEIMTQFLASSLWSSSQLTL